MGNSEWPISIIKYYILILLYIIILIYNIILRRVGDNEKWVLSFVIVIDSSSFRATEAKGGFVTEKPLVWYREAGSLLPTNSAGPKARRVRWKWVGLPRGWKCAAWVQRDASVADEYLTMALTFPRLTSFSDSGSNTGPILIGHNYELFVPYLCFLSLLLVFDYKDTQNFRDFGAKTRYNSVKLEKRAKNGVTLYRKSEMRPKVVRRQAVSRWRAAVGGGPM